MIKKYLIAGLLVWLPIWVTFFIIKFLVDILDNTIALLPQRYQPEHLFGINIPGLGILAVILVLIVTGLLMTNFIGHKLVDIWEGILSRIPLIRSIHSAVKQVANALLHPEGAAFRKVLLIEYPREGLWSIAFLTSEKFNGAPADEETYIAFVPTTPNPTSGFLTIVPKSKAIMLEISVEEALRMVISLGVVMPDSMAAILKTKSSL